MPEDTFIPRNYTNRVSLDGKSPINLRRVITDNIHIRLLDGSKTSYDLQRLVSCGQSITEIETYSKDS